ncbi:calcium-binding protein [Marivivens marinus]|uniref:calcium-binding protein n=1 Tax=Marivivens marinus TaxID=3110173 RepID=UPI003B845223
MALFILPLLISFGLLAALFTGGEDTVEEGETVSGTNGDDDLTGGDGDDTLSGRAGDDILLGRDGDDAIFAGAGNDYVDGGAGDDDIYMGDGDDTNFLPGVDANDNGDDVIRGGAGADVIVDVAGSNTLLGGSGWDEIYAVDAPGDEGTPDILDGGWGKDILVGDAGDTMTGGEQYDEFDVVVYEPTLDPVLITDWEHELAEGPEVITLVLNPALSGQPVSWTTSSAGFHITVGGQDVAIVQGATSTDQINALLSSVSVSYAAA